MAQKATVYQFSVEEIVNALRVQYPMLALNRIEGIWVGLGEPNAHYLDMSESVNVEGHYTDLKEKRSRDVPPKV